MKDSWQLSELMFLPRPHHYRSPSQTHHQEIEANNLEPIIIIIDEFYWHHSLSSLLTCIISFTCHTNPVVRILILTHLELRKLRYRKIKSFSQDDWNCNWLSQNLPESTLRCPWWTPEENVNGTHMDNSTVWLQENWIHTQKISISVLALSLTFSPCLTPQALLWSLSTHKMTGFHYMISWAPSDSYSFFFIFLYVCR